jgi:hypothetical protein
VILFPPVARLVGLVLLAVLAVALIASAAGACPPGYELSPSTKRCVPDCKPACLESRIAEARQPLPQPQVGAGCPTGYNASPTSGMCTPSITRRCRAIPKVGAGWELPDGLELLANPVLLRPV